MKKYELNLRDYWRIIKKRHTVILLTALVVPAVTVLFTLTQRPAPVYEAAASVRIERSTSLTGLFMEVLAMPSGDNLATQALIIKSYPVLEKVAKEMGLIPRDVPSHDIAVTEKYAKTLSELQGRIKAEQDGNTSIINITVSSGDSKTAQRMANLVAEKFKEESILSRNHQIFEAKKFIEEQLSVVESRLKSAEETMNIYKRKKDVISISDEQKSALDRFASLEGSREKTDLEMKEVEYFLSRLKGGKAISDRSAPRPITDSDPQVAALNSKLSEMLFERDNLLIGFLPAHPQVKDLDAKIANLRRELTSQLESKQATLAKRKEFVSSEMGKVKGGLSSLPSTAMELSRLERDVKINQELFSLLKTKYQEALIKEAEKVEEVSIIKRALEPASPKNPPRTFSNALLGLALGAIFGLVFAFIFESLDTSIGTIEDVEAFLGMPVIGVIPHLQTKDVNDFLKKTYNITSERETRIYQTLISHFMPKSIPAECYRSLRTNALFTAAEKNLRSIMITSSSVREGKTLTAINLAVTLAQVGKRVLLIDADFRNPGIHYYFGVDREPGFSNVILGNSTWQDVVKSITDIMMGEIKVDDLMATPGMDNITIMTCGLAVTQPSEFLNSTKVAGLIAEMSDSYDFVIFDAPPVLPVADAIILGNKVDAVFMVYEVGRVARSALKRTKFLLENVGAKIMGTVLNNLKAEVSPDFYQGGMYRYYREEKAPEGKLRKLAGQFARLAGRTKSGEK
ncbi:MAG: polysaccharide biosynthesis tyrosine autokinase [Deltaproteobacteria bacterium]|nr:polysaccharide biosynthesis tyrosine autokinase [Deltaproteobacteria bacterium]